MFESNYLLSLIRDFVSKNKKLKTIKVGIESSTSRISELFTNIILGLKWQEI